MLYTPKLPVYSRPHEAREVFSRRDACGRIPRIDFLRHVNARHQSKRPVPTWSRPDMDFFLHGSMSTEMAPERVLRALAT